MTTMLIPIVALLCVFSFMTISIICKTLVNLKNRERSTETADDIKIMQEIHQSLNRMEQRIEALETILFDQHRKDS